MVAEVNILDLIQAERDELLAAGADSMFGGGREEISLAPGTLTTFPSTFRGVDVTGAVDLRHGAIHFYEGALNRQFVGGAPEAQEALRQGQVVERQYVFQGAFALIGAVLGFMTADGEFVPHPVYDDPKFAALARQTLTCFVQRFRANPEVVGVEYTMAGTVWNMVATKASPTWVEWTPRRDGSGNTPRAEVIWHWEPPTKETVTARAIADRQKKGVPVAELAVLPDVQTEDGRPAAFVDFCTAWVTNLQDAVRRTNQLPADASDEQRQAARRLVSAITGVAEPRNPGDEPRRNPERASVSAFKITVPKMGGVDEFSFNPGEGGVRDEVRIDDPAGEALLAKVF